ncbi:hypothetical protein MKW92_032873, partial [Papaver armeniacum]
VKGDGFIARGLTFDNWAGPAKHQAVALLVSANRVVCDIYGTIDFIFGDAAAVFQNCRIYARRPLEGQFNTITAQSRKVKNTMKTYLGRPWNLYSRVVFMLCHMGDHIDPSGWSPWEQNDTRAFDTLYYGEYLNDGLIDTFLCLNCPHCRAGNQRVNWTGFHNMTSQEAEGFTVNRFINGSIWLPSTESLSTEDYKIYP